MLAPCRWPVVASAGMDLTAHTAADLAESIASGEHSCREVVDAHLDRIAVVNPELNAIVSMRDRDDILAEADRHDRTQAESGVIGPLHGLPMAVKDLQDVAGFPTRHGSVITPTRPARSDGLLASRLRAAGAIIIGKTNTPEFGTGSHTFNEVFGVTRNPHDATRSAGGSSGGAAAALASHMLPLADGSDLGGSLRNPAAFCGVVGLRPGVGRVPSPSEISTHVMVLGVEGPMGRNVQDVALLLSVLAGPDPLDPLSRSEPGSSFAPPLSPRAGLRIGWGGDLGRFRCEPELLAVCRAAVGRLADAGHHVDEDHPDLGRSMDVFRVLRGIAYRSLGGALPDDQLARTKATVRENVEFGRGLGIDDLLRAEASRVVIHREMLHFFETHDVLAMPTTQVRPFPVEVEFPTEIDGHEMADYLEWMTSCCIITPTGCPAISIPCGTTSDGLPVGLQLVAPIGEERRLLEIAATAEAVFTT